MNKIKMSIIASSLLLATVASANQTAEELVEALNNSGELRGSIKAFYYDKELNSLDSDSGTLSLALSYTTPRYLGWHARIGGQVATEVVGSSDMGYVNENKADGFALSELFIGFDMNKAGFRFGRQYVDSPILATDKSGIINESIQGALWAGGDNRFQYGFGWFNDFQTAGDGTGDIGDFDGKVNAMGAGVRDFKDIYTLFLGGNIAKNLYVNGQYAHGSDVYFQGHLQDTKKDVGVLHLEAQYTIPMESYKLKTDAMYRMSNGAEDYEGSYYSARVGVVDFGGLNVSFAYGQSDKSENLIAGFGGGADDGIYTSTMINGGEHVIAKDTTSYLLDMQYDFGKSGINGISARFQYGFGDKEGLDFYGYEAELAYRKNNIETALQLATYESDLANGDTNENQDFRFKATYRF